MEGLISSPQRTIELQRQIALQQCPYNRSLRRVLQRLFRKEILWRTFQYSRQFVEVVKVVFRPVFRVLHVPDESDGNIQQIRQVLL